MNGLTEALKQAEAVSDALKAAPAKANCAICPPATLAGHMAAVLGDAVAMGGQNCHADASGAHTGDISAEMWADIGAEYVIVGHSERRESYGETNEQVAAKAAAVIRAGLTPIICIGESLAQRQAGETLDVLGAQLRGSIPAVASTTGIVIAYEPIWAIGSGLTPTLDEIADTHAFLRTVMQDVLGDRAVTTPIQYGGSVKPANASDILALDNVDGALVGGASLKAEDFLGIIRAAV